MKDKHIWQRFIGGWLVSLSVISLALFVLQAWTCALGSPSCVLDNASTDSRLAGGGFYWWTTIVQAFLLLSLVLAALGSLVSLRMSRQPEPARRCLASRDADTLLVPALRHERTNSCETADLTSAV